MAVPCGDQRDFEFRDRSSACRSLRSSSRRFVVRRGVGPTLETSQWPVAYVGDARYVQSADTSRPDGLDLNGIDSKADDREDERLARGAVQERPRDQLQAPRTGCSAASAAAGRAIPIVYDATGRPHTPACCRCCFPRPIVCATDLRRRRAFSDPESPLDILRDLGRGRVGPLPRTRRGPAGVPEHETNVIGMGGVVLVRDAPICRYDRRRPLRRPRGRGVLDGTAHRRAPPTVPAALDLSAASSTPCCTCCSALLRKVLYDLGHVQLEGAVRPPLSIQACVQAEIYVDNETKIEGDDRAGFTYEGNPSW